MGIVSATNPKGAGRKKFDELKKKQSVFVQIEKGIVIDNGGKEELQDALYAFAHKRAKNARKIKD